jgi:hypothetical protein
MNAQTPMTRGPDAPETCAASIADTTPGYGVHGSLMAQAGMGKKALFTSFHADAMREISLARTWP